MVFLNSSINLGLSLKTILTKMSDDFSTSCDSFAFSSSESSILPEEKISLYIFYNTNVYIFIRCYFFMLPRIGGIMDRVEFMKDYFPTRYERMKIDRMISDENITPEEFERYLSEKLVNDLEKGVKENRLVTKCGHH
jgi:hypothetical protein